MPTDEAQAKEAQQVTIKVTGPDGKTIWEKTGPFYIVMAGDGNDYQFAGHGSMNFMSHGTDLLKARYVLGPTMKNMGLLGSRLLMPGPEFKA
jgi:hypothetical protein